MQVNVYVALFMIAPKWEQSTGKQIHKCGTSTEQKSGKQYEGKNFTQVLP